MFCQQELPVLIGVQLVPGIIKSKGWLAIATLKQTFTFLGFYKSANFWVKKTFLGRDFAIFNTSIPTKKVNVGFKVAMGSQPFEKNVDYTL